MKKNKILKIVSSIVFLTAVVVLANMGMSAMLVLGFLQNTIY